MRTGLRQHEHRGDLEVVGQTVECSIGVLKPCSGSRLYQDFGINHPGTETLNVIDILV